MNVFKSKLLSLLIGGLLSISVGYGQDLLISGGNTVSAMICENGQIYTWGSGIGNSPVQKTFPSGITLKAVDAGSGAHFIALDCNSNAWSWGSNGKGQLGIGNTADNNTPTRVVAGEANSGSPNSPLGNIKYISGGNDNSYVILADGRAMSWGRNDKGQLGNGNLTNSSTPVFIKMANGQPLTNVIQIEAGDETGYALADPDGDGQYLIYSWGAGTGTYGGKGMLGRNATGTGNNTTEVDNDSYARPVLKADGTPLTGIVSISAGDVMCLALDNQGYVWAWGNNSWNGNTGQGITGKDNSDPRRVLAGEWGTTAGAGLGQAFLKAKSISAGQGFSMAVTTDGKPMSWGGNGGCGTPVSGGSLGNGATANSGVPVFIRRAANTIDNNVLSISDGDAWGFYRTADNKIYTWGNNSLGQLGTGSTSTTCGNNFAVNFTLPCTVRPPKPFVSISPRDTMVCLSDFTNLTLRSNFVTTAPADFKLTWYKDGVQVATGNGTTGINHIATQPGKYKVIAEYTQNGTCIPYVPAVDSITIGEFVQTFTAPANLTYCGDSALVNVNSTSTLKPKYSWFASNIATTPLGYTYSSGTTKINVSGVTATSGSPKTKTVYVEETSFASGAVMPTQPCAAPAGVENSNLSSKYVRVVVYEDIVLDSLTVIYCNGDGNSRVGQNFTWQASVFESMLNSNGVLVPNTTGPEINGATKTVPGLPGNTCWPTPLRIPVQITLKGDPAGKAYFIRIKQGSDYKQFNCTVSYPITDNVAGEKLVEFTGTNEFGNAGGINEYKAPLYNLTFTTKQKFCDRIPVVLTEQCPCNKPTSVTITQPLTSPTVLCEGAALTLKGSYVDGGKPVQSAINYIWYKLPNQAAIVAADYKAVPVLDKAFAATVAATDSGKWVLRVEDGTAKTASCYTEDTIHIKIDKPVIKGVIAMDTTLCFNTDAPAFTVKTATTGGNGSTYKYQWFQSPKSPLNFTKIAGATAATYDPGILADTTLFYRRDSSGVCAPANTNTLQVNMLKELLGGTVGKDTSICSGTAPVAFKEVTAATGGDLNYKYQWQSASALAGPFADIASATASTYSAGNLSQTTYFRRVVKTTKPVCAEVYSNTVTVTVIAKNDPGTIAKDDSTCFGIAPSAISSTKVASGSSAPVYSWVYQEQGNVGWSPVVPAVATDSYSPPVLTKTTSYRRIALTGAGTCNLDTTDAVTIKIYTAIDAGTIGSDTTICSGNAPKPFTGTKPTGGTGTYSYQWIASQTGTSPWIDISSAVDSSYVLGNQTVSGTTTVYFKRVVKSGNCPADTNNVAVKFVVLPPVTAGKIGNDTSICPGSNPLKFSELTAASGGDGTFTYKWQRAEKINGNFVFKDIASATNKDVYPTESDTVETRYRRIDSSATCASKFSNVVVVTMLNGTNPGSILGGGDFCTGTASVSIANGGVASGGSSAPKYFWIYSTDGGTSWIPLFAETGLGLTIPGNLTDTTLYSRVAITGAGKCDTARTSNVVYNVYEQPVAGAILKDTSICFSTDAPAFKAVKPTKGYGTYHYKWYQSVNGAAFSPINTTGFSADSSVFDPGVLTQPTAYKREVRSGNCPAITETAATISITQNDTIKVKILDANPKFCINSPATFVATPTKPGLNPTYQWYVDNSPVGTNSPQFSSTTLVNGQSVKVQLTSSLTVCVIGNPAMSNAVNVVITDSITPSVIIPTPDESCVGLAVNLNAIPSAGGVAPKYEWFVNGASVGNNNPLLSSTAFINNDKITVKLTADSTGLPCYTKVDVLSNEVKLLIYKVPTPNIIEADTSICEGGSVKYTVHNERGTIQWYKGSVKLTGKIDSVLTISPASVADSGKYYAVESRKHCSGTSDTVTLNVIKVPVANAGSDMYVLDGDVVTLNGSGGGLYEWSLPDSLDNPLIFNPKFIARDNRTFTLTVFDSTRLCSTNDEVKIFVERPIIIVNTFTPNGDGVNDGWVIKNIESFPRCLVKIYNRWGNLVWESHSYPNPWDGTNKFNDQLLPDGTYFYIIELNSVIFKNPYQGWVQIIK